MKTPIKPVIFNGDWEGGWGGRGRKRERERERAIDKGSFMPMTFVQFHISKVPRHYLDNEVKLSYGKLTMVADNSFMKRSNIDLCSFRFKIGQRKKTQSFFPNKEKKYTREVKGKTK